ncbi:MAG: ATP-dependent DNA helicase [Gammaproteobacteria bacterium]|jgi:ATP-dependent DNA helicase DinG
MSEVAEVFDPVSGSLARLPAYRYRESQQRMAEIIWRGIGSHRHAALEAGTGVGKTFAYLVPAILCGRRTIVSTGTKPLQDQIFDRDLPLLAKQLGRAVEVVVLKGRANYLCWHRLELARADEDLSREDADVVVALSDWGRHSASGDLSELADLDSNPRLRARVTSSAENCLAQKCAFIDRCFVAQARRAALDATVVVVNHHLLLADLALKETGFGDLLGEAELVVVDEAHLMPEIAQDFFSVSISTREFEMLLNDLHAEMLAARVDRGQFPVLAEFSSGIIALRRGARAVEGRRSWRQLGGGLVQALSATVDLAETLAEALGRIDPPSVGITRCRERLLDQARRARTVLEFSDDEAVRWFDASARSLAVHATPLEFGAELAQRIEQHGGQWVFTSATLAVGADFSHFLERMGLAEAETCVLPSPFDYARQAGIYLPEGLPDPGSDDYPQALLAHVWPLIEAAGGGVFLLFTSHRALQQAAQWVELRAAPGPVLVQGAAARTELLQRFREHGNAILLGTGSFWQGVDVRGNALRVVVIDKLPFAVPNDPQVEVRTQAIRRRGGNPFVEFQLPQAVLALKQGVGRLIRDFDDTGLIVLGDPRVRTRNYGQVFIDSLPPAHRLSSWEEALEYAQSLHP